MFCANEKFQAGLKPRDKGVKGTKYVLLFLYEEMVFEKWLLSTLVLLLIKSNDRKNTSKFKYRKQMKHFLRFYFFGCRIS